MMKQEVLQTLSYFGLFDHPLTEHELHQFLGVPTDKAKLQEVLLDLEKENVILIKHGYIQLSSSPSLHQARIEKEKRAKYLADKSKTYAGIIASFPFVNAVGISGSISKLSAKENADLDFFIITTSQRLWITRSLLHLFKKITFLTGHQHYFCMNYFVAEDHLNLPFKNMFTAIELSTLIPVYGKKNIAALKESNLWTQELLPNHSGETLYSVDEAQEVKAFKRLLEVLLNVLAPVRMNSWLMRLTSYKWRKKHTQYDQTSEAYERAFYTRPYISKNHPHDYQHQVMSAYKKVPYAQQTVTASI